MDESIKNRCMRRFKDHKATVELENEDFLILDWRDKSGSGKQYRCEMDTDDHEELLTLLLKHKGPAVISGYETGLYSSMLAGWNRYETTAYSQVCSKKREIIWMNYDPPARQMEFEDMEGWE